MFSVTETGGAGFFTNAEETRSEGMEASVIGQWGPVSWLTGYSFIEARYESAETLAGVVDPDGLEVEEGDRIPGIPRHNFKFGLDWAVTEFLALGGDVIYASEKFLHGGNNLPPIDGYVLLDLRTKLAVGRHVEVWIRVDNVFDTDYETGGPKTSTALPIRSRWSAFWHWGPRARDGWG